MRSVRRLRAPQSFSHSPFQALASAPRPQQLCSSAFRRPRSAVGIWAELPTQLRLGVRTCLYPFICPYWLHFGLCSYRPPRRFHSALARVQLHSSLKVKVLLVAVLCVAVVMSPAVLVVPPNRPVLMSWGGFNPLVSVMAMFAVHPAETHHHHFTDRNTDDVSYPPHQNAMDPHGGLKHVLIWAGQAWQIKTCFSPRRNCC